MSADHHKDCCNSNSEVRQQQNGPSRGQGPGPGPGRPPGQGQGPGPGRPPGQGQGPGSGRPPGQGQGPGPGRPPGQGQGPGPGRPPGQGQGPGRPPSPGPGRPPSPGPGRPPSPPPGPGRPPSPPPGPGRPPGQGQGGQPMSAPPNFIPVLPQAGGFMSPGQAGEFSGSGMQMHGGSFRRCLNRFTYVWLFNGNNFWFYPVFVGRNHVEGFRWRRNNWVYDRINTRSILFFRCF